MWREKRIKCQKDTCQSYLPDEGENCINMCVSSVCYEEVYSKSPLEDGEIDLARHRAFTNCFRREERKRISHNSKVRGIHTNS